MGRECDEKKEGGQEMKTLVVAQQKGGVGKTSTVVHLALDFLERGRRVVVIDLDTQANASFTLAQYKIKVLASGFFAPVPEDEWRSATADGDGPRLALIEADPELANAVFLPLDKAKLNLKANLKALANRGFDVCLIDTAPGLGVALVAALYAADCVLSPIELEAYSIQGIKMMLTTLMNVRKENRDLQFLGMVPSKVDARNPRHVRHQAELQSAYPKLVVPASIGLRSSIADALASGVPVWKIRKTAARKAAHEVRALAAYVFDKMEIA